MGRSVSTPSNATARVYFHCDFEDEYAWDEFVDDVQEIIIERYKSFYRCDKWLDREDHAILENGHAFVTVSEYCGVVAICLVPKDEYILCSPELAQAWCERIHWQEYVEGRYSSALRRLGTMSNGVSVYERVKQ